MKVIVVFKRLLASGNNQHGPAIYSNGGNRWNILGFNFTNDALSSVYKISMICTLIRRAGRAGGKSGLCRQKLVQDFSFKIHLFPQNVLQNLVRPTSKSVTFRCFCYL
jgi:hypothetical protein